MDIFAVNRADPRPRDQRRGNGRPAGPLEVITRLQDELHARSGARLVAFDGVEGFVDAVSKAAGRAAIDHLVVYDGGHGLHLSGSGAPPSGPRRTSSAGPADPADPADEVRTGPPHAPPASPDSPGSLTLLPHDPRSDDWELVAIQFGRDRVTLRNFDAFGPRFRALAPRMGADAHVVFLGSAAGRDPVLLYRFAEAWQVPCSGSTIPLWGLEALDLSSLKAGTWTTAGPDARFLRQDACPIPLLGSSELSADNDLPRGKVS